MPTGSCTETDILPANSTGTSAETGSVASSTSASSSQAEAVIVRESAQAIFDWYMSLDYLISLHEETTHLITTLRQSRASLTPKTKTDSSNPIQMLREVAQSLDDRPKKELEALQEELERNSRMHAEISRSMHSIHKNTQRQHANIKNRASDLASQWLETHDSCSDFFERLKKNLLRRLVMANWGLSCPMR